MSNSRVSQDTRRAFKYAQSHNWKDTQLTCIHNLPNSRVSKKNTQAHVCPRKVNITLVRISDSRVSKHNTLAHVCPVMVTNFTCACWELRLTGWPRRHCRPRDWSQGCCSTRLQNKAIKQLLREKKGTQEGNHFYRQSIVLLILSICSFIFK